MDFSRFTTLSYDLGQTDFDALAEAAGSPERARELWRVALRSVFRGLESLHVARRSDGVDVDEVEASDGEGREVRSVGGEVEVLRDGAVQPRATAELREALVGAWDDAWVAAAARPSWREVPVTTLEGQPVEGEAARAAILDAYRVNGCVDAWLVAADDLEWLGDDTVCAGPTPEQIDWTGLDEALRAGDEAAE